MQHKFHSFICCSEKKYTANNLSLQFETKTKKYFMVQYTFVLLVLLKYRKGNALQGVSKNVLEFGAQKIPLLHIFMCRVLAHAYLLTLCV